MRQSSALFNRDPTHSSAPLAFPRKFPKVVPPSHYLSPNSTDRIPAFFFIAKFKIDVQGFMNDDDDMFCLKVNVDFMKNPF
jgi:hypothetical protein